MAELPSKPTVDKLGMASSAAAGPVLSSPMSRHIAQEGAVRERAAVCAAAILSQIPRQRAIVEHVEVGSVCPAAVGRGGIVGQEATTERAIVCPTAIDTGPVAAQGAIAECAVVGSTAVGPR
jgi:hypothetical protein